uniref:Uncharacterized protein n=1 Tax=viral metagenome TaxID=1070528 RepID=A0A6C0K0T6_9ZZZZ
MPTVLAGYERVMINGIPVWKNKSNEYYAYEPDVATNPICIGSQSTGIMVDWEKYYLVRLNEYRENLASRVRAGNKK